MNLEGTHVFQTGSRLIQPLHDLLILHQSISIAMNFLSGGAKFNEGDYATYRCLSLNLAVILPLTGPVEAAMSKQPVVSITIRVVPMPPEPQNITFTTDGLNETVTHITTPVFTNFFEGHVDWLLTNVDGDKSKWPDLFRFATIVRNSAAHGGRVHITNPNSAPASWRNLTYGPADNGRKVMGGDMSLADVMALMFDMSEELDALGAPIP